LFRPEEEINGEKRSGKQEEMALSARSSGRHRQYRKGKRSSMIRLFGSMAAFSTHAFFTGIVFVLTVFWWHGRDLQSTAQLAEYQPATLSRVYSNDGALLAEFSRERRLFSPIDEVPALVRFAFISAEDKNFMYHDGVDWLGIVKASIDNVRRFTSGHRLRGASTITQQVVKNFLLDGQRRLNRKINEILLAMRLEEVLSKEQILELYLNEIFLGVHSYGVTTAALRYFGKKLEDLTPAEAAYLAALPKAPSTYHPVKQKERAIGRRNYVLKEMRENGYITIGEYDEAIATKLLTVLDADADIRVARTLVQKPAPIDYFSEEIRRELIADFGEERVYGGGLTIRATVDPELQALARKVMQKRLFAFSRERGFSGPAATLDPEKIDLTNEIAWREALSAVDLPRDLAPWKRAVVLAVGKQSARIGIEGVETDAPIYLPFSDVKEWAKERKGEKENGEPILGEEPETPAKVWALGDIVFVEKIASENGEARWSMRQLPQSNGALVAIDPRTGRVLAMQGGFSYDASTFNRATQAQRQPGSSIKPFVYAAALENGYQPNSIVLDAPVTLPQNTGERWKPRNYSGRFHGPSPLRWGIEKSHNLMTVRLAMDVSLEKIGEYTERLGVYEKMPHLYSYALGSGETTLMKLTASYAMLVNGGRLIEPTLVDRIQDRHGRTVFRHDSRICSGCRDVEWTYQPEPYIADEGVQVVDAVTAYQLVSMLQGVTSRGTASKIGKSLGFSVGGKTGTTNEGRDAWFIGFTPELAVGCYIGFDTPRPMGPKASGGKLCAPVFEAFMKEAMGDGPFPEFRRPAGAKRVKINRHNGCAVPNDRVGPDYIWEFFRTEHAPLVGQCPRNDFQIGGFGEDSLEDTAVAVTSELDQLLHGNGERGGSPLVTRAGGGIAADVEAAVNKRMGAGTNRVGRPQPPAPAPSLRTDGIY
jgi:penicillin-binding protein 1A